MRGAESKAVVVAAVEQLGPGKPGQKPIPGFAALEVVPDAAAATLEGFLKAKVRPAAASSRTGRKAISD